MTRLTRGLLLAVLGLALIGAPSAVAAGPARLTSHARHAAPGVTPAATIVMVDNDGKASPGNCNGGGSVSSTIQGAIDAASNDDTILVCPGLYQEQVTITELNNVTVKSIVPFGAVILTPHTLNEPYLVGIGEARNITFQGFKLVAYAMTTGCEELPFGILTFDVTGVLIAGNRIQTTGGQTLTGPCGYLFGIQVGEPEFILGTTAASAVRHSSLSTAGGGTPRSRATLASNLVSNFKDAGISVTGQKTNADILQNSVHFYHRRDNGDTSGCVGLFTTSSIVSVAASLVGISGIVTNCVGIGIFQAERAGGRIQGNAVLSTRDSFVGPASPGPNQAILLAGILQLAQRHAPGKTEVKNNLVRYSLTGIALLDADGSHVIGNHVRDTGIGVFIHQTQGVTVEGNTSTHNAVGIGINDALLLGGSGGPDDFGRTSSANVIQNNDARHNNLVGHASNPDGFSTTFISCFDNTTGAGTAGTDNTWTTNQGEDNSSDPLGICGLAVS